METNEVMNTVNEVAENAVEAITQTNRRMDAAKYGVAFLAGAVACKFVIMPCAEKIRLLIKSKHNVNMFKHFDDMYDTDHKVVDMTESEEE